MNVDTERPAGAATAGPAAATLPWHRQLHVRLGITVALLLAVLGVVQLAMVRHYTRDAALESLQRLHLGLAGYVAEHLPRPLLAADDTVDRAALEQLAGQVMSINPMAEVYLLDGEGHVRGHALETSDPIGDRVDLAPVRTLAATSLLPPPLPVFGTDPRRPGQPAVASAAPLYAGDHFTGYLYVVLRPVAPYDLAPGGLWRDSAAWRQLAVGGALATVGAGGLAWLLLGGLVRPLRRLTAQVSAFRGAGTPARSAASTDEIGRLADAVTAMRQRIDAQFDELQAQDRLRRELVSNISHDLHTPLSALQGYAETLLLRNGSLSAAEREDHLQTLLRHAQRLQRRVADLFQLSMLDAGRVQPALEPFSLAELCHDVAQDYALQADAAGIRLRVEAPGGDTQVLADIALIERVLQNLVDNALRHTPAGGEVCLALTPDAGRLRLSVADTGCGVPPEALPHLFERYWHAPPAASSTQTERAAGQLALPPVALPRPGSHGGTGLGLAIVHRIVELHGSAVQVRSRLQRGTTFSFGLPLARSA